MSVCYGSVCYSGEFEFKTALVSALSGIVPIVREGVYTGEDAENVLLERRSNAHYSAADSHSLGAARLYC